MATEQVRKPRVVIAIPSAGNIHVEVVATLCRLINDSHGCRLKIDLQPNKPVDNCRNYMIKRFLEDEENDYLLFMDSDNPPQVELNPLEYIERDCDIVGFPTPIWKNVSPETGKPPIIFNVFTYLPDENSWISKGREADFEEVDAMGSGCLIIARRVLEKVKPAFQRQWDEHGCVERGSDLLFCKRVKEAGFKIWCAWKCSCHHYKTRSILEIWDMMEKRDVKKILKENINTPEYWNGEWGKRPERILPFYDEIAKRVGGQNVLDFGCGRGDLLARLGPLACGVDHSKEAVDICRKRGLKADVGTAPFMNGQKWDAVVSTEVLEHLDDDIGMIQKFFEVSDRVIYTVPFNCLPPGVEPEHQRVYTKKYIRRITPHIKELVTWGDYLLVEAQKE